MSFTKLGCPIHMPGECDCRPTKDFNDPIDNVLWIIIFMVIMTPVMWLGFIYLLSRMWP